MSDITIEIHLSSDAPEQIIELIKAHAALAAEINSRKKIGKIHNATVGIQPSASVATTAEVQVTLVPSIVLNQVPTIELKTGKKSSGLRTFLIYAGIFYHVTGGAVYTVQFIEKLQPYVHAIMDGTVVSIEQAKKAIRDLPGDQLSGD